MVRTSLKGGGAGAVDRRNRRDEGWELGGWMPGGALSPFSTKAAVLQRVLIPLKQAFISNSLCQTHALWQRHPRLSLQSSLLDLCGPAGPLRSPFTERAAWGPHFAEGEEQALLESSCPSGPSPAQAAAPGGEAGPGV